MRRLLLALVPAVVTLVAGSHSARAQFRYAGWNSTYNTDVQTLKYTPVRYTAIEGDEASCKGAIDARGEHLGRMERIEFYTDTPNEVLVPNKIPMVVITGGRANFLARNLRRQLPAPGGDLNALDYWDDWLPGTESKWGKGVGLWYDDRRTQRPLYLVVDHREYANYYLVLKSLLTDPTRNVRLVGCRIVADDGSIDAVGFGAQRVCAVELMKAQGRDFAWILDDNIATLKGLTNLDDVETPMRKEGYMAMSFNPDNTRQADTWKTREEIAKQIQAGANAFAKSNIVDAGPGDDELMQQAVLWNIGEIARRRLTFSPYFVESAEDLMFTRYLKQAKAVLKIVKGITVVKITGDNTSPYSGEQAKFAQRFAGYAVEALQRAKAKHTSADNAIQFRLDKGDLLPVGAFVQTLPRDPVAGPMLGSVRITAGQRDSDGKPVEHPAVTARKIVENTLLFCFDQHPKLFTPMFTSPPGRVVFAQSPLRAYTIGAQNPNLHPPHQDVAVAVLDRFERRLVDLRFSVLYTAARVQILRDSLLQNVALIDTQTLHALKNASDSLIDTSAEIGGVWAEGGLDTETTEYLRQLVVVGVSRQLDDLGRFLQSLHKPLAERPELSALKTQVQDLETTFAQAKADLDKLDLRDFLTH